MRQWEPVDFGGDRTSLMVEWLRLRLSVLGVWV